MADATPLRWTLLTDQSTTIKLLQVAAARRGLTVTSPGPGVVVLRSRTAGQRFSQAPLAMNYARAKPGIHSPDRANPASGRVRSRWGRQLRPVARTKEQS